MKRSPLLLSLVSSLAIACSGSGFDDQNDENQDVDGETAKPSSGDFWMIDTVQTDTCGGVSGIGVQTSEIKVKVPDSGDFTIEDADGGVATCKPSKIGFDCAFPPTDLNFPDAATHVEASMHIKWTSADRFEGTLAIDSECTGSACDALAQDLGGKNPCFREEVLVGVRKMPESFAPEMAPLTATLSPMISTCATAPEVALTQQLRIEPATNQNDDAQIFVDDDPTPHDCSFIGEGRVSCFRLTFDGDVKQFAQVSGAWTGPSSFEGEAELELSCDEGKDCTGNALGLPCTSYYQFKAVAAASGAP